MITSFSWLCSHERWKQVGWELRISWQFRLSARNGAIWYTYGNPSGQSSRPLAQIRGPNGSQDEIAELTATVAKAKAENNKLECDKVEGRASWIFFIFRYCPLKRYCFYFDLVLDKLSLPLKLCLSARSFISNSLVALLFLL